MKKIAFVFLVLALLIAATAKNGHPESESVTMILLGANLVVLTVFGRWLFLEESQKPGSQQTERREGLDAGQSEKEAAVSS